ncbi:MAG: transglutaminase-like domain-containing protein, partial [Candidatus Methylomirabilota bacterium]
YGEASSYGEALKLWRNASDVNAWIGAKFQYNTARAMQLSETQRTLNGRMPILSPESFFSAPNGVCVDLARFAVETLRVVEPETNPRYVMIEFDPASIAGNTLRRHWVVSFRRGDEHYFFADSKRPGHMAGPYASTQEFIHEYARFRARRIVSFRELESYARRVRTPATKQSREDRP